MSSLWKIHRLVFVIFSLYLLSDVFYRWDGFSHYASFSDFLPSVALISIIWSIIAVLIAFAIWLLSLPLVLFFNIDIRKIRTEQLHIFTIVFFLLSAVVWLGKRSYTSVYTSLQLKILVLSVIFFIAIFSAWILTTKARHLKDRIKQLFSLIGTFYQFIQERITFLVWLFGIWIVISVFLVGYHTWFKGPDKAVSQGVVDNSKENKRSPNIILVTFDALTARDMSLYGYSRPTTPFLEEWAKKASVFTGVEAESNFTGPTTASLMTGKMVWSHQRFSHMPDSRPVGPKIETLPYLLKKNGYYMMAFVSNNIATVDKLRVADFFDIAVPFMRLANINNDFQFMRLYLQTAFDGKIKLYDWLLQEDFIFFKLLPESVFDKGSLARSSVTVNPPEVAFNILLDTLNKDIREPYFVWIHINPPHTPYLAPEPYMGMFDSSEKMRLRWSSIKGITDGKQFDPEIIGLLRARYNEFIRYCDSQFEDFINNLKNSNKIENTVILLSADHGESFEHNSLTHGASLYEPETNIPLIIKLPDQSVGKVINNRAAQVDIPATILELANIQVPLWMEGRSLLPLIRDTNLPSKPIFSMMLAHSSKGHKISEGTFAVWEDDYKLIHNLEENKSELFNLRNDPDERNNLFDKEPEIGQYLRSLLYENLEKANNKIVITE